MTARVTVTAADCRRDVFRCGGAGGQNVNKRETGVRFTHLASGAVGEGREHRTQAQNERAAWRRMAESPAFQRWAAAHLAALEQGFQDVEHKVDQELSEGNLRVEVGVAARPGDVVG